MRIAVVGAPKSGKTQLAKKLEQDESPNQVIDNIAQNFSKRTNIAIGFPSDYRADMILAGERLEKMLKTYNSDNCIFTSTILDSMAHARVRQLIDEEIQGDNLLMGRTMAMVDLFYHAMLNTFKFDKVFYLPYDGKDEKSILIAGSLLESLDHFGVKYESYVQEGK